ncbi:MAG: tRNA (adenosine(37)-N6)-threonylcarbamoyltransferase complex ATPase subunit type 1 TsaE [Patescibacteria group bacterium]
MEVTLEKMREFAAQFVARLPKVPGEKAHIVGLSGDLGAGKTTFVQHVARELGVKEQVTSPTFVIAQAYQTTHPLFTRLVHTDAYRLEGETKDTVGFEEFSHDPHTLMLVEWPEKLPREAIFPADASVLKFEVVDDNTRNISYA